MRRHQKNQSKKRNHAMQHAQTKKAPPQEWKGKRRRRESDTIVQKRWSWRKPAICNRNGRGTGPGPHNLKKTDYNNHTDLPSLTPFPPFFLDVNYMDSIKTATLNINGLTLQTRVAMLEAFIRLKNLDVLLLQEVIHHILDDIPAKCRALLLGRLYQQGTRVQSVTASWLHQWGLTGPLAKPHSPREFPLS
jgi:hypothetical protein